MSQRIHLAAAAAVVLVWSTMAGHASVPQFWQISTQEEFLDGDIEHLTISATGRVRLGPAVELVHETASPFLWATVETADGSLWLGSGNDGKVIRIGPDGVAASVHDAGELEVHALAAAAADSVYAATSPDGRVLRVAGDGTVTPLFDPDERYIWSLVTDAAGVLFVGTGETGIIYKVSPDGSSETFYDTRATHVTALAIDGQGRLLAGTESPGRVFRIDADGKAFVLLESGYQEIHAIKVDADDVIYATAVSGQTSGGTAPQLQGPPASAPRAVVSTEITVTAIGGGPPQTTPSPTPAQTPSSSQQGAVFRIAPDGIWDVVWESTDDSPYDVLVEADGALIIGTGNDGKVFQVTTDPSEVTLLTRAGGQQVTSLIRSRSGDRLFTTANPGKLFRLSATRAAQGTYVSDVRDADTIATWGSLRWSVVDSTGAGLQLFTRSGNTATPDETWSDWAGPYANPRGSPIQSPKARFLQWKAVFDASAGTTGLSSVTAAFLERNLRPQVTTLTVHPPGVVFQQPFTGGEVPIAGLDPDVADGAAGSGNGSDQQSQGAPTLGRRVYRKGLQSFGWTARDGNDDQLEFAILYRGEDESEWKLLKAELTEPIFAWDTSSVPDGSYTVKVVVSDERSNSPGAALTGERVSTSFDIDNSSPTITVAPARPAGGRTVLPFTVRDGHSAVQRVEYSLDAKSWVVVYPLDGIPDSSEESFEVEVAGEVSRVIIRATDTMNNGVTAVGRVAPTAARRQ